MPVDLRQFRSFVVMAEEATGRRSTSTARTAGPLVITLAEHDHTVPPAVAKSNLQKYRHSSATTEFVEFPRPAPVATEER